MIGLHSISSMGIGLTVYLDDQFSKQSTTLSNHLTRLGRDTDDFARGLRQMEYMGGMIERVGGAVYSFSKDSLDVWARFEDKINRTAVVAGISKTNAGYNQLQETANKLARVYGILPEKIAAAELELAYAGKSVPEINKMAEAVATLARATGAPVEGPTGTATILSNIMQAYNASSGEAMKYADIMTSAANRSTIEVKDLAESMRYSADVATSARVPFQEAAATIAALGNAGLRGSMAGTAYANMLRYIQTGIGIFGTKRQKTSLGLLGITAKQMQDEKGHLIGISQLLKIFKEKTRGLGDNDKFSVLQGIFGVRGNRAFGNLLKGVTRDASGKLISTVDAMLAAVENDVKNHVTQTTAARMLQSLKGQEELLQSNWTRFQQDWGKNIAPLATSLIRHLNSLLVAADNFINSAFGKWLINVIASSGVLEIFVGKLLIYGARFMGYLLTSGNSMRLAGEAMEVGGSMMRKSAFDVYKWITMAADNMVKAMTTSSLEARNIAIMQNRSTGNMMLGLRGAGGRFVGGRVGANSLTRMGGALFGWGGARAGAKLTGFFEGIGKTLGFLKVFGSALGFIGKFLFSWEFMLADLVSTLLTGKSLFTWLWDALKWLAHTLLGIGDDPNAKSITTGERYHSNDEKPRGGYIDLTSEREKYQAQQFNMDHPINLHVTVNPTTGDKRTERHINNINQQSMSDLSIEP